MKKNLKSFVALLLLTLCVASLCSCTTTEAPETTPEASDTIDASLSTGSTEAELPELWKTAIYTENKEFGSGNKKITVEVTAGEKSVVFTVNTDKNTVGEALIEHGLIAGEEGEYGLYVKTVNGILADYDIDQSYWSFFIGEDLAPTGVDSTEISEATPYKLVYTK